MTIEGIAPDLAARRVIVAAYCYYVLDHPIMSDGEYDQLSAYVADHWDELEPIRRWQLGNPADTRAGGSHIKYTTYSVCAARRKLVDAGVELRAPFPSRWRDTKRFGRYVTAVA